MSKGEPGSALEKLVRSVMQHVAGILHPQSSGDGERPEHTVSNAAELLVSGEHTVSNAAE